MSTRFCIWRDDLRYQKVSGKYQLPSQLPSRTPKLGISRYHDSNKFIFPGIRIVPIPELQGSKQALPLDLSYHVLVSLKLRKPSVNE